MVIYVSITITVIYVSVTITVIYVSITITVIYVSIIIYMAITFSSGLLEYIPPSSLVFVLTHSYAQYGVASEW